MRDWDQEHLEIEQMWNKKLARIVEPIPRDHRTAFLNDLLRITSIGGRLVLTAGVARLSEDVWTEIVHAVRWFDEFNGDNDPHGEHDCGVVTVAGLTAIWKIDYYDLSGERGSPDPADVTTTRRVLTIMLADEY